MATSGVLQLDHLSTKPATLRGEWEFYWEQLLTPADFQDGRSPPNKHLIHLPRSWKGYVWEGQALPSDGYATFRLILKLHPQDVGRQIALRMPTIFHAYKLWIDGHLLAEVGQVGTDKDSTVPRLVTRFVTFQPTADEAEIVIQVANFHHAMGGITKYIEIGDRDALWKKTILKYIVELFLTSSLFIIGVYHLLLYLQRRKDKAPLFFGLFTLGWSLRSLVVGELLLTQMFPEFPWELQLKIEYLVFYGGLFFFTMYFDSLFKEETPRWLRTVAGTGAFVFSLLVIVTPAKMYSQTLVAYELIVTGHMFIFVHALLLAIKRRKEGGVVFFVVSMILAAAVLNDFLYYNGWVLFGSFSVLGLFIFTFAQMYLLSSRFVRAEADVEKTAQQLAVANNKLLELNENLEHIVHERTHELKLANDQLRQAYDRLLNAESGRKKLLSYISHDLRAPLSSMLGYVEAVQDNIRPEKNAMYLKYVHDRIVWLTRMIEDLSFLSHLEMHQVPFEMQRLSIEAFVRDFWAKFEPVIREAGLNSKLQISPPSGNAVPRVLADPVRIEQGLSNLLSNALKFTPQGDTITLSLSYREIDGRPHAVIGLADTGIGIPPEHLEQIFERYYKHYPSGFDKQNTGSGLGLAITKEIIDVHQGKIWAESTGTNGSTFFVALPLMAEEKQEEGK